MERKRKRAGVTSDNAVKRDGECAGICVSRALNSGEIFDGATCSVAFEM